MRKKNFKKTIGACYIGYITQAIVNNFAPLLFLTFEKQYAISISKITLLVTVNFLVQLLIDLLSAGFVEKIGMRCAAILAHVFATVGLVGLAVLPNLFSNAWVGLLIAVVLYAIGGGLDEVIISPILEACPTEEKSSAMSLLHSFYCWGSVAVVGGSTLLFHCLGIQHWGWVACIWAIVPLCNAIFFCFVPIGQLVEEGQSMSVGQLLKTKLFWLFSLLMICAGASELAMSQWASTFVESALHLPKTVGDLLGPCMFAICMGIARVVYAKIAPRVQGEIYMIFCGGLCVIAYILVALCHIPAVGLIGCGLCGFSVGVMWPGTFSIATRACPKGGTAMFALLALAGDMGCSSGPTVVGMISGKFGEDLHIGIGLSVIFPIALILGCLALHSTQKKAEQE